MTSQHWKVLFVALLHCILFSAPAMAKKIAFIAGVDRYDNLGDGKQLQRAVADSRAMAGKLNSLGFKTFLTENGTRKELGSKWQIFLEEIQPGDEVVVFFSGHGVEIEGQNFLLPKDVPFVKSGRQEQIKRESLSLSELLLDIRRRAPAVTLVILDACRDNPFIPAEHRSAINKGSGLAKVDAPQGTFIMYAAGAGEIALDRLPGEDPKTANSVYTRVLLQLLEQPCLDLPELARKVRVEVSTIATTIGELQRPAYYDGIIGTYYLAGCRSQDLAPDKSKLEPCEGSYVQVADERQCLKPKESFRDCADCPEMVVLPLGEFVMGLSSGTAEQKPERRIKIGPPLAVGRFEVTFREWDACVDASGCTHKPHDQGWGRGNRPVVNVSWNDIVREYLPWLNRRTGQNYRLLSEAEWEYAARGVTSSEQVQTAYAWGDEVGRNRANCRGCGSPYDYKQTAPVGTFEPNAFNLHDMHGNVWEWVADCWHANHAGAAPNGSARTVGCSESTRVIRGGSWYNEAKMLTLFFRHRDFPSYRHYFYGFRIARPLHR